MSLKVGDVVKWVNRDECYEIFQIIQTKQNYKMYKLFEIDHTYQKHLAYESDIYLDISYYRNLKIDEILNG